MLWNINYTALFSFRTINKLNCLLKSNPSQYFIRPISFKRNICTSLITRYSNANVNTKVIKNVLLFKYDNPRLFKVLNIFAICQCVFWMYLSNFCYSTLRDAPVIEEIDKSKPFWRRINLGENKYRYSLTSICFVIGFGILAASWMYTLRSVRFLILKKGGDSVIIVTYGPLGRDRIMNVDLKNLTCNESRQTARVQLPIKVKNSQMYYSLDMRGEFLNPKLFDFTAGMKRSWKS